MRPGLGLGVCSSGCHKEWISSYGVSVHTLVCPADGQSKYGLERGWTLGCHASEGSRSYSGARSVVYEAAAAGGK